MNRYKLTVYNEKVRTVLDRYIEYKNYLDGKEIEASNENEARMKADEEYNIRKVQILNPSMKVPEPIDVNDYGDLWINPKYTKIELIS